MHIAEGLLPPAHAIGWTGAAAPFVAHGARAVVKEVLGAVRCKPPVMALLGTIVLLFQALLLAHGGLTTLGANAFAA